MHLLTCLQKLLTRRSIIWLHFNTGAWILFDDDISTSRDNSVRPNIERIFKIWEERHVYNKEFVDELMAILSTSFRMFTYKFLRSYGNI